jgi:Lrp/AsnC family transcriptional regulator for asnA, asnC and gidA
MAMIGIRVEGDLRDTAATLADLTEVDYVVIVGGSFDILAEVICEDDQHLLSLLNDKIRAIPGVRSVETFTYLDLYKQTYSWGT